MVCGHIREKPAKKGSERARQKIYETRLLRDFHKPQPKGHDACQRQRNGHHSRFTRFECSSRHLLQLPLEAAEQNRQ